MSEVPLWYCSLPAMRSLQPASERRRDNLKVSRTITCTPRPEWGLDCLTSAIFARQRTSPPPPRTTAEPPYEEEVYLVTASVPSDTASPYYGTVWCYTAYWGRTWERRSSVNWFGAPYRFFMQSKAPSFRALLTECQG